MGGHFFQVSLYTHSHRNHRLQIGVSLRRSGAADVRATSEMMITQQCSTQRDAAWEPWQLEVLDIIRAEYAGVLEDVSWSDVDWSAWRPLFDAGHSPRDAVLSAFGQVA